MFFGWLPLKREFTYFLTNFVFFRHLMDLPPGIAKHSEVPEGSFDCCKFAHRGPDRDGWHFWPQWAKSQTPKLLSGNSEFLAIPGGKSTWWGKKKKIFVKNANSHFKSQQYFFNAVLNSCHCSEAEQSSFSPQKSQQGISSKESCKVDKRKVNIHVGKQLAIENQASV